MSGLLLLLAAQAGTIAIPKQPVPTVRPPLNRTIAPELIPDVQIAPGTPTLSISVAGRGFVDSDTTRCAAERTRICVRAVVLGEYHKISATAGPGWKFVGWSSGCMASQTTCGVRATAEKPAASVGAVFVPLQPSKELRRIHANFGPSSGTVITTLPPVHFACSGPPEKISCTAVTPANWVVEFAGGASVSLGTTPSTYGTSGPYGTPTMTPGIALGGVFNLPSYIFGPDCAAHATQQNTCLLDMNKDHELVRQP